MTNENFTPKNLKESYKNNHTLDSLISARPTEETITEVVELVAEEVKALWDTFNFQYYEPQEGDTSNDYFLMFQISPEAENKEKLFALAMENGIDGEDTTQTFYEFLEEGKVLPLSDELGITFSKEGTGIMDLRTGGEIRVIASFTTKDLRDKREEEAKDDE